MNDLTPVGVRPHGLAVGGAQRHDPSSDELRAAGVSALIHYASEQGLGSGNGLRKDLHGTLTKPEQAGEPYKAVLSPARDPAKTSVGSAMRIVMRAPLPSTVLLGLLLSVATAANAADIAAVLGSPGDTTWTAACGADGTEPPDSSAAECPAWLEPLCMHRKEINTIEFPRATCSDGTPGTFYIRRGTAIDENKWVIHLQGGAGCEDYDSCLERWCGWDFYNAGSMSSDWDADGISDLPDHFAPLGHQAWLLASNLSSWTHVYVHYCSSDAWLGRASDVTYSDGTDAFDVDARGHKILHALRKMLRKRNDDPNWTAVDGYDTPDLDDAEEILFTGTSAGGWGALESADWFLSPFAARSALVVDAGLDIKASVLRDQEIMVDTSGDGVGDVDYADHLNAQFRDKWQPGGSLEQIDAFVDESCRAVYEPLGRLELCTLPSRVLSRDDGVNPVIQTPTFVRLDLEDAVLSQWFIADPNPDGDAVVHAGPAGAAVTLDDYASMARDTLARLYSAGDPVSGVYGPRCGHHVGLERSVPYRSVTTPDTIVVLWPVLQTIPLVGSAASFEDSVWDWFNSGGAIVPNRHLDTAEPGLGFSGCP